MFCWRYLYQFIFFLNNHHASIIVIHGFSMVEQSIISHRGVPLFCFVFVLGNIMYYIPVSLFNFLFVL